MGTCGLDRGGKWDRLPAAHGHLLLGARQTGVLIGGGKRRGREAEENNGGCELGKHSAS